MHPAIVLGVPEMDADHAVIEPMFERVSTTPDAALADLFREIEAEVIAHFAREEALMEREGVPVLHCHQAQHRLLLGEFAAARPSQDGFDAAALRERFAVLAGFVAGHVGSVDRVTAQFLGGTLDPALVQALRLPDDAA
ncbi:bacteriohemerythrin [Pinisolibacter aquiterrae]|uniref:bacteriohemerythrin n=1 Tax=Pinisolibacter aquiterrae TaxID=2815579 RepID=UPI001C3E72F9|nr:hemerythrin family protein [Pinisolibacter aquiterrae]MBV5265527.1 hemerythrin family protein [Pinisolibacter aquiterrae]MCC8236906.1 hemerythrin family protein [Pinisolibacter aquiterrae]